MKSTSELILQPMYFISISKEEGGKVSLVVTRRSVDWVGESNGRMMRKEESSKSDSEGSLNVMSSSVTCSALVFRMGK